MKILRRKIILITLGYAIAATVMTYPLLFQLSNGVVSQSADAWILVWGNWWIKHALATGQNIFFTPLMFFPNGVSLASHSFSFTHTAISALFQVFTDPIVAYNLGIWLIFPVSALSMYALARHVVRSDAAAWLAGLIYAFAPYHMTQALGHPHLSYVQFIPLGVLFTLKSIESPRARYLIGAVVCFALTAYAGPHLLVVAFTWLALFLPFDFIANHRRLQTSTVVRLIVIGLGSLIVSLPLLLPAASDMLQGQSVQELQTGDFDNTQTDALAYFVPTRYQPVLGELLTDTYANLGKNNLWMPYLGYAALLLAVVGVASQRRRSLGWLVAGLMCIVLALGPQLRVNGVAYPAVPLPFALLQNIFPFSFLRSPDRFNIVVPLSLALLAAWGFAAIGGAAPGRRWPRSQIVFAGVVTIVILFEYLSVPYPMLPLPEQSPFIAQIANDAEPYAVLDLPMGRNPSKVYLYWQTLHHKALVEGHVSRTPDRAYDFIEANPLLRALRSPGSSQLTDEQRASAKQQLADRGVRFLLVHIAMSNPDQMDQFRALIGADPVYADDVLLVYATR
jgi:hypothetical protein